MKEKNVYNKPLTAILFAVILLTVSTVCNSQEGVNKGVIDSLQSMLNDAHLSPQTELTVLKELALNSSSPDDILLYSSNLWELAVALDSINYMIAAKQYTGVAYRLKGDLTNSLNHLLSSVEMALDEKNHRLQIQGYSEIAAIYTSENNLRNALYYDNKAVQLIRDHGKPQQLAISLLNTGYSYYTLNDLDSALALYNEAEQVLTKIDLPIGNAYTIGNRALIYWKKGDYERAEEDLLRAINMLEPLGDQFGIADYHNQLASLYLEQNKQKQTIQHTEISVGIAKELGLKEQIRDAVHLLSKLYEEKGEYKKSLEYQTQYIAYQDSIENTEQTKRMANMRTEFEVNLREKEIDVLEKNQTIQQTYIIIAVILLILSIVILLYFRQRFLTTRLVADADRKQQRDRIKDLLGTQETKALQAMVRGRDNERKRLAQELHNHLGSLLATVKVNLNGMDDTSSPKHRTITQLVDQACTDIRNMSHSLNMGISENFGLIPALKELVIHLQRSGELKVEFTNSMREYQLDSDCELVIYRIVQELVSNVLKHAKATHLSISLTYFEEEHLVNILVEDNGRGFDPKVVEKESKGMGLGSLQKMVSGFQGDIILDAFPDRGTTINIDLPVSSPANLIE